VIALQIAYLPAIYSAYNRRETLVTMLESRAGVPAWGPELLVRHRLVAITDTLPELYDEWEQWSAEVNESHTKRVNYESLAYRLADATVAPPAPWSAAARGTRRRRALLPTGRSPRCGALNPSPAHSWSGQRLQPAATQRRSRALGGARADHATCAVIARSSPASAGWPSRRGSSSSRGPEDRSNSRPRALEVAVVTCTRPG
jgi:hypothetical protein